MAFLYADRVKETSNTTGTGTLTLAGAVSGFQTFSTAIGNGNTCKYVIESTDGNWELGIGTVSAGALARTTVQKSTNANAAVNFTVTPLTVYCCPNAAEFTSFVGDSGSGGRPGFVPAPAAGDATKVLLGDGTWGAVAGTGTVTSVGLSTNASYLTIGSTPVTSAGTITANKTTGLTANQVVATPDGVSGAADLRALVAADIPNLNASKIAAGTLAVARGGTNSGTALNNNRVMVSSGGGIVEAGAMTDGQLVIGSTGAAPVVANLTAGSGINITNSAGSITIANTGSGGTVTSVGMTGDSVIYNATVGGSPVTGAGTLVPSLLVQNANKVLAGPDTGADATPTFRALVAADIPNLNTSKLTAGTLPIARGGTNSATALSGSSIMISDGTSVVQGSAGTSTQVLHGNASGAPTYGQIVNADITNGTIDLTAKVTGVLPVANGGTNSSTALSGSSIMVSDGTKIIQGSAGTSTQLLHGNASGTPTYGQLVNADITNGTIDLTTKVTGILPSANGGTANGFTKFSGPATAEKTFTLPNASATILTDNAAVTVAQGGTGNTSTTAYAVQCGGTTSTGAHQAVSGVGTSGQVLTSNGAGALPTWQAAPGGTSFLLSRVTTQADRTTTTLSTTNMPSWTLSGSTTYSFFITLICTTGAGGLKFDLAGGTCTATTINAASVFSMDGSSGGTTFTTKSTALSTSLFTTLNISSVTISGTITVNAGGTFIPQFAQNSASGTSSVLVGSWGYFVANP